MIEPLSLAPLLSTSEGSALAMFIAAICGGATSAMGAIIQVGWYNGQHMCSPSGRWRQNINGCAVIRCTRPNICVIATMLHMARDRSWMFCSKVVVVPMDRQFEVLPIMSAGDYVTHGDTLYISHNLQSRQRRQRRTERFFSGCGQQRELMTSQLIIDILILKSCLLTNVHVVVI